MLNYLVNHQSTQLNAETKNQALNRQTFRVLGRLYCLIHSQSLQILGIEWAFIVGGIHILFNQSDYMV